MLKLFAVAIALLAFDLTVLVPWIRRIQQAHALAGRFGEREQHRALTRRLLEDLDARDATP